MIRRIDSLILATYQWGVDKTQIQPEAARVWIFRAVAMAALVRCLIHVSDGMGNWLAWAIVLIAPLSIAFAFWLSRLSAAQAGSLFHARVILLVVAAIPFTPTATNILAEIGVLCELSLMYLAMCTKPKPPVRRAQSKSRLQEAA